MFKLSKEEEKEILNLYTVQNKSMLYISKKTKHDWAYIKKILIKNNVEIRDNNFYKSKNVDESFF